MKRLILLACCIGWLSPTFAADSFSMGHRDYDTIDTMIGLWGANYKEARKCLEKDQKFPLTVTLRNGDASEGGEEVSYVISSLNDLPEHNVPVACPGGKYKISKCWFIKYGDQW